MSSNNQNVNFTRIIQDIRQGIRRWLSFNRALLDAGVDGYQQTVLDLRTSVFNNATLPVFNSRLRAPQEIRNRMEVLFNVLYLNQPLTNAQITQIMDDFTLRLGENNNLSPEQNRRIITNVRDNLYENRGNLEHFRAILPPEFETSLRNLVNLHIYALENATVDVISYFSNILHTFVLYVFTYIQTMGYRRESIKVLIILIALFGLDSNVTTYLLQTLAFVYLLDTNVRDNIMTILFSDAPQTMLNGINTILLGTGTLSLELMRNLRYLGGRLELLIQEYQYNIDIEYVPTRDDPDDLQIVLADDPNFLTNIEPIQRPQRQIPEYNPGLLRRILRDLNYRFERIFERSDVNNLFTDIRARRLNRTVQSIPLLPGETLEEVSETSSSGSDRSNESDPLSTPSSMTRSSSVASTVSRGSTPRSDVMLESPRSNRTNKKRRTRKNKKSRKVRKNKKSKKIKKNKKSRKVRKNKRKSKRRN